MKRFPILFAFVSAWLIVLGGTALAATNWVEVAKGGRGFILSPSGQPFTPWGFNYDRDSNFRLIEDYWDTNWTTVEQDFGEMKQLGANVVRIHLQFAKFMKSPTEVNETNLVRLRHLVELGENACGNQKTRRRALL